ncbi:MAG: YbjN domain-containing protein [Pseudomonadota bacterium]
MLNKSCFSRGLGVFCLAFTLAVLPFATSGAQAEDVSASDAGGILKVLRDRGQTALATIDEFGDPFIETSVGNVDYHILFYGCTDHRSCSSIALRTERASDGTTGIEDVNGWNAEQRWTKVYTPEVNILTLELDVWFGDAPIPADRFGRYLDVWERSLSEFVRFVDSGEFDFVE